MDPQADETRCEPSSIGRDFDIDCEEATGRGVRGDSYAPAIGTISGPPPTRQQSRYTHANQDSPAPEKPTFFQKCGYVFISFSNSYPANFELHLHPDRHLGEGHLLQLRLREEDRRALGG